MATSKVKIMNLALRMLGSQQIMTPDQDTRRAKALNDVYDEIRDQELIKHHWNFAINRATLAETSSDPAWGYDHSFQLPTDPYCLKVISLKEEIDYAYKWVVEGRLLLTDADSARIKYIMRVTDPNEYSPEFVEVFAARMGAEAAFDVTGKPSKKRDMFLIYNEKLEEAWLNNAYEGMPKQEDEARQEDEKFSWIAER